MQRLMTNVDVYLMISC